MKAPGSARRLPLILCASLFLTGIASAQVWDSNDFLVAGFSSDNIAVYDQSFVFKGFLDTGFNAVVPLDFTSSGNVVAAGRGPGEVREYDVTGALVNSFTSSDLGSPIDGKIGPLDLYYVGTQLSSQAVREFDLSGTSIRSFGGDSYLGVAVLPAGTLWANPGSGPIDVFDLATGLPAGTIVLDNGQNSASSMFYSAVTDTVLTTDTATGDVFERTTAGAFVRNFAGPPQSFGVTRGPGGDVFATDCDRDSVFRWQADGTFISETPLPELNCAVGIVWTGNMTPPAGANLVITKDDGTDSAFPGESVTYTITAFNVGPDDSTAAAVADLFPPELSCTWTCAPSGGASCTAGPVAGDVADAVSIPAGDSVVYTAVCDVDDLAVGTVTNTATVTEPSDPFPSNNSATDVDTLVTPMADLHIAKTDGTTIAVQGDSVTYTITVGNGGLGRLFAYDATTSEISEIDPASGGILNTFPSPVGSALGPDFGLATTASTLLAGGTSAGSLFELDPDTGATLRTLANPGVNVSGMAFLGGEIFLLTDSPFGEITVLDYSSGAELRTLSASPVFEGLSASGAALFGTSGSALYDVDPLTGTTTLLGSLGAVNSEGIGIIDDELFISNFSQIEVFDLATLTPLRTLTGPSNMEALGADGAGAGAAGVIGATVTDSFPPELSCTWTCVPTGGASCTAGPVAGDIDDTVDIPAGDSVIYTAICDVSIAAAGDLSNTATVTPPAGLPDPNTANNSSTDVDVLVPPMTDLRITKDDGTATAVPGGSVTYTVTVDNRGSSGLGRLFAYDQLTALIRELDPVTGASLNSFPSPVGSASGPDFGLATTATTLLAGGISSGDLFELDPDTGATLRTLTNPGIGISGMAFLAGEIFLLTDSPSGQITVLDYTTGAVLRTLSAAPIRESLGASATALFGVSATDAVYDVDPLTGATTLLGTVSGVGRVEGVGVIGGELFLGIQGGTIEVFELATLTPLRTMTVLGDVEAIGADGGDSGGVDVFGATVTDIFPPELSCTWTCVPAGGASCTAGPVAGDVVDAVDIPLGDSVTYTAVCAVAPSAVGTLANTATVTPALPVADSDPSNNGATDADVLTPIADLTLIKDDSRDPTAPGRPLGYTLTIANAGPSDATFVTAFDTLPPEVSFISTSGCANDPDGVPACTLGTIPAGSSASYTIEVLVARSIPDGATITNLARFTTAATDPDPAGDVDSEATTIDAVPPIVTLVGSVADTGDGVLAECEEAKVAVTGLLVSFNEAVQDPPGDSDPSDVTNPANYRLVAAGPDGDFATGFCGPVPSDDVVVPVDAVAYDPASLTATLAVNGDTPLADALHRLLVCGDTSIRDLAGNRLDGNFDGFGGDDFLRTYRVDVANLFSGGHFDCDLDPWLAVSNLPEEIEYSTGDALDSTVSGSAAVTNLSAGTAFSLGQCLAVAGGSTYTLSGSARADVAPGVPLFLSRACDFFADPACAGPSLLTELDFALLDDTGGDWLPVASDLVAPAAASSALCSFDLTTPAGDDFDVNLDDLDLRFLDGGGGGSEIFSDDLESGDMSRWSSSVH